MISALDRSGDTIDHLATIITSNVLGKCPIGVPCVLQPVFGQCGQWRDDMHSKIEQDQRMSRRVSATVRRTVDLADDASLQAGTQ